MARGFEYVRHGLKGIFAPTAAMRGRQAAHPANIYALDGCKHRCAAPVSRAAHTHATLLTCCFLLLAGSSSRSPNERAKVTENVESLPWRMETVGGSAGNAVKAGYVF